MKVNIFQILLILGVIIVMAPSNFFANIIYLETNISLNRDSLILEDTLLIFDGFLQDAYFLDSLLIIEKFDKKNKRTKLLIYNNVYNKIQEIDSINHQSFFQNQLRVYKFDKKNIQYFSLTDYLKNQSKLICEFHSKSSLAPTTIDSIFFLNHPRKSYLLKQTELALDTLFHYDGLVKYLFQFYQNEFYYTFSNEYESKFAFYDFSLKSKKVFKEDNVYDVFAHYYLIKSYRNIYNNSFTTINRFNGETIIDTIDKRIDLNFDNEGFIVKSFFIDTIIHSKNYDFNLIKNLEIGDVTYNILDSNVAYFFIKSKIETNKCLIHTYSGHRTQHSPELLPEYLKNQLEYANIVYPVLRGSVEAGYPHYLKGVHENKINTVNDLITLAKYLVEKNFELHLFGISHGGFINTSATLLNPYLFKTNLAVAPVINLFKILDKNKSLEFEFGNPLDSLINHTYQKISPNILINKIDNVPKLDLIYYEYDEIFDNQDIIDFFEIYKTKNPNSNIYKLEDCHNCLCGEEKTNKFESLVNELLIKNLKD